MLEGRDDGLEGALREDHRRVVQPTPNRALHSTRAA